MRSEKRWYVWHWEFFGILLVGMGFEQWEVGFRKKWAWKWDSYPLQYPLSTFSAQMASIKKSNYSV